MYDMYDLYDFTMIPLVVSFDLAADCAVLADELRARPAGGAAGY